MNQKNLVIAGVLLLIVIAGLGLGYLVVNLQDGGFSSGTTHATQQLQQLLPARTLGNFVKYSNEPLLANGKVRVIFIGAEFCPFCATERWPIVEALNKFGTFSELKETISASFNEPFLDLPTYNFMSAKYNSKYIQFDHKETGDRNFRPLEKLTRDEELLFNAYNPRGSIPFLLIGGKKGGIVQIGVGYSPEALQGLTFSQVQAELKNNPNSKLTQDITKEANIITALICYNNDNQPAEICTNTEIANLVSQLT